MVLSSVGCDLCEYVVSDKKNKKVREEWKSSCDLYRLRLVVVLLVDEIGWGIGYLPNQSVMSERGKMVLQCLTWIPHLVDQLVRSCITRKETVVSPLPDDVIIEILTRLPADFVLECRMVCTKWRKLISSPYFAEEHLKRVDQSTFVQLDCCISHLRKFNMLILDEAAQRGARLTKICVGSESSMTKYHPKLFGSCNGLLLFQGLMNRTTLFVSNPTTHEEITLSTPTQRGCPFGIFFHPTTRQYKLLFVQPVWQCYNYFIQTVGAKMWRQFTSFPYRPAWGVSAAISNGSLHWMVDHQYRRRYESGPCQHAIMVFNMDSENIRSMPHPGKIELLSIQNGELLLAWNSRGLFWYHLEYDFFVSQGRLIYSVGYLRLDSQNKRGRCCNEVGLDDGYRTVAITTYPCDTIPVTGKMKTIREPSQVLFAPSSPQLAVVETFTVDAHAGSWVTNELVCEDYEKEVIMALVYVGNGDDRKMKG
ncbi:hypothetical protein RJ640_008802 [Escallonia rubra]|uniref:F-box domain-containing protein n=1 Tax=Escallonia rubra TaxID=112253 RepID=A0AA88RNU0_9ASTE|nr:hypothetical protein RJ640_008802 [Escallonia rubra]